MQLLETLRVEACAEALCQKGCRQVRRDILVLESGGELPETRGLTRHQRAILLAELRQIMAVYDGRCRID